MSIDRTPNLRVNATPDAQVIQTGPGLWRLEIPAGPGKKYRLAQLDDYAQHARGDLPWRPPLTFSLRARASAPDIPGTWGFGLWNDPFSLSLGLGGGARRFPALPNAAWFFHASPPNYLSFRDDLPAQGFLMAAFRSLALPAPLLALAGPALPLMMWPPAARLGRRLARRFICQDAAPLSLDPTGWHTYALTWRAGRVAFTVDGQTAFETSLAPRPPLGLVLWIDNQYATLPPDGRLGYGSLPNPEPAWIELADITVTKD